jgi:hypothetical protein
LTSCAEITGANISTLTYLESFDLAACNGVTANNVTDIGASDYISVVVFKSQMNVLLQQPDHALAMKI